MLAAARTLRGSKVSCCAFIPSCSIVVTTVAAILALTADGGKNLAKDG